MRRLLRAAAGLLGVFVLVSVVVHVPAVQRALGWGRGGGACPFGYTAPAARAVSASVDPEARPALGFVLDRTTRADIDRWASSHAVSCAAQRGGTTLECTAVPARAVGSLAALDATTVWFDLPDRQTLRAVRTVRRAPSSMAIVDSLRSLEGELVTRTGVPTATVGAVDAAELDRGLFHRVEVEHRAGGYRAVVNATNVGDGFVLTERYVSTL